MTSANGKYRRGVSRTLSELAVGQDGQPCPGRAPRGRLEDGAVIGEAGRLSIDPWGMASQRRSRAPEQADLYVSLKLPSRPLPHVLHRHGP